MTEAYRQTPEELPARAVSFSQVEQRLTILSTVVLRPEAAEVFLQEAEGHNDILDAQRAHIRYLEDLKAYKEGIEQQIVKQQRTIEAMAPEVAEAQAGLNMIFKRIDGLTTDDQLVAFAEARERAAKIPPQPSQSPRLIQEADIPTVQRLQPVLRDDDQMQRGVLHPELKAGLTPLNMDDQYQGPLLTKRR